VQHCAFALPSFTSLQHAEFMYARLALRPGENEHYSDNDLVLLCKTDPMVGPWVGGKARQAGRHTRTWVHAHLS